MQSSCAKWTDIDCLLEVAADAAGGPREDVAIRGGGNEDEASGTYGTRTRGSFEELNR